MIFDTGCFLGSWPFRSLPAFGLRALKRMAARHRVTRAAVSSFEEIFREDGFEATRAVATLIAGEPWLAQFQVVNPTFPGWEKDLERGIGELGIEGLRLAPGYHAYSLAHTGVAELIAAAREHGLPVALHVRLQDERMHWICRFPPVPMKEVEAFLERSRGVRIGVMGCEISEIRVIAKAVRNRRNVWVDWSRLRALLGGMDRLLEIIPPSRVLYGSLWPLQTPSAMLNLAELARLGRADRKRILWDNGLRFLGRQ